LLLTERIVLREHQPAFVTLSSADAKKLDLDLEGKIRFQPTDDNHCRIEASSYVGFLRLPDGRILEVRPKVGIVTVFAMLAAVYDVDMGSFNEDTVAHATMDGYFEVVVAYFAELLNEVSSRGILKGYQDKVAPLQMIRGRILLEETLSHRPGISDQHTCRFRQFSADVPENRVIRTALDGIRRCRYQDVDLPGRLRHQLAVFQAAQLSPRPVDLLREISFHRLNERYRPALRVAGLLLENLTFTGTTGDEPYLGYLVDMNWLFEKYVGTVLKRNLEGSRISVALRRHHPLDRKGRVTTEPDHLILVEGMPVLVLDSKYKISKQQEDIYQVLAYCHALSLDRAYLIHPPGEDAPAKLLQIREPGAIEIGFLEFSLYGGPSELDASGKDLCAQIQELIPEANEGSVRYRVKR
jgi:5-methylcytosine-specific restriction enzyme subunit McrC